MLNRRPLSAAERVDLGVFREPPQLLFRKGELAIDGDLEHTGNALNQLDLGPVFFLEPCPRTEGSGEVVSRHAVFDPDLHPDAPLARKGRVNLAHPSASRHHSIAATAADGSIQLVRSGISLSQNDPNAVSAEMTVA